MPPVRAYLDHAATSPPSAEVVEALGRSLRDLPWNAGAGYEPGLAAKEALAGARSRIRSALGADKGTLVFTSGGTESNNAAVHAAAAGTPAVAWVAATAHPSQVAPVRALAGQGWTMCDLPCAAGGVLDLARLDGLPLPRLVALEWVNPELGFLQPVAELAAWLRARAPEALVLVDAAQGFGKLPPSPLAGVDAVVLSGHKLGAPVGVGALWMSNRLPRRPLLLGGGQEEGLRSGTVAVPLALAFRDALAAAAGKAAPDLAGVMAARPGPRPLPRAGACSPYIWALDTAPVDGEVLMHHLEQEGIIIGLGSACRSSRKGPSAAHLAAGLSPEASRRSVRLSLAPGQERTELEPAWERLVFHWRRLGGKG